MAERLNGILKNEYFPNRRFKTITEDRKAVVEVIHIYNTRRLHERCRYKTPVEFRKMFERKVAERRAISPPRGAPNKNKVQHNNNEPETNQEKSVNLERQLDRCSGIETNRLKQEDPFIALLREKSNPFARKNFITEINPFNHRA